MLKKRIIPCLDLSGGQVVKGIEFDGVKAVGDPVERALYYNQEGADEIAVYDISASIENRSFDKNTIRAIADKVSIPLSVGGGIRSVTDVYEALCYGADKVSLNTAAFKNPSLIEESAKRFGSQCVVLSVDCRNIGGKWCIMLGGGKQNTGVDAERWIGEGIERGAGEIIVNTVGTDGTGAGYALDFLKQLRTQMNVPIIASGGAGQMADFESVFKTANVDGALAASVFHYGKIRIQALKAYLSERGIMMRYKEDSR